MAEADRIEIIGFLRIGGREESFEFRGTIVGETLNSLVHGSKTAPIALEPVAEVPAGTTVVPVRDVDALPRSGARDKTCVNCNLREGRYTLVRGPRNERAVPRILCSECVNALLSAGRLVSVEFKPPPAPPVAKRR